jgi:hypothetical protein
MSISLVTEYQDSKLRYVQAAKNHKPMKLLGGKTKAVGN